MHTIVSLLIGALVGWLAGKIMHSRAALSATSSWAS